MTMKLNSSKSKLKGKDVDDENFTKDEIEALQIHENQNNLKSKQKGKDKVDEEYTKEEIEVLRILEIMRKEKDLEKLSQILRGNSEGSSTSIDRNYNYSCSTTSFEVPAIISRPLRRSFQLAFVRNFTIQPQPRITNEYNPPNLPPVRGLHRDYILGCSRPMEKELQHSDVKPDQNRLLLNKKHVENYFLPLLMDGENLEKGIEVIGYDMNGNEYSLTFKKWADKYYVLCGGWKVFFQSQQLMSHDYVTVWMFRHSETKSLCVALGIRKG